MTHSTILQDVPLKQCKKCKEWLPTTAEFFHRKNREKDGFAVRCKICQKEDRLVRKDLDLARGRAYYAANKERVLKRTRARQIANKEQIVKQKQEYYAANKERILQRTHNYYVANREVSRASRQRRRALLKDAEGTHTAEDIQQQYKNQRGRCYYCHAKLGDSYHMDHIVPLSRGGSNGPDNLVCACASCNTSKQDKLPHEWARGGRLL